MKVLFVSSGNKQFGLSPIVQNQGDELKKSGLEIDYLTIKGKGILGYIKNIPKIRKTLVTKKYDLVHAHYSLAAITVSLSLPGIPVIASLMGSDTRMSLFWKILIKLNSWIFWHTVLVKSEEMKSRLRLNNSIVIPNGVDINKFKPIRKDNALRETGWDITKLHILFAADPNRPEKNFTLAKDAFELLENNSIEIHYLDNVPNEKMPFYHNAADVVLLTSLWEGSPNVIKEAMACNRPVVCTNVGDVKENIHGLEGHFLAKFDSDNLVMNIKLALQYSTETGTTDGRNRLQEKGLDSNTIAEKILNLYKLVLPRRGL